MGTDLVNNTFRYVGLFILVTLCYSMSDLRNAEAVRVSADPPAEAKFSCMIAKSAYGSPSFDESVRRLHRFRNRVLMGSAIGRWVAKAYYHLSESLAPQLDKGGLSGGTLRWAIRAFLYMVKYLEVIGLGTGIVLLAFIFGRATTRANKAPPFSP